MNQNPSQKELNEKYDVYIVTAYIWKEDVIDAVTNLKNKFEYLNYWFPFIDINKFIFIFFHNCMYLFCKILIVFQIFNFYGHSFYFGVY